jgi:L-fuconolactonase
MFPEQRFILDHLAKPFIRDGLMAPWREDLAALAQRPNIYCKISGLVTEADLENWSYEDFVPYLDAVFEYFGTERLMLGSDWPVCLLAGSYQEVIRIGIRYLSGFNPEEQAGVLAENCMQAYQIP